MKANYEITIKFQINTDIKSLEGFKTNTELANDIAMLVCDELATPDSVATFEVLQSCVSVE